MQTNTVILDLQKFINMNEQIEKLKTTQIELKKEIASKEINLRATKRIEQQNKLIASLKKENAELKKENIQFEKEIEEWKNVKKIMTMD